MRQTAEYGPKPPGEDRHALAVRVYYEDTDAGGVVYYANYLRFLERARTEFLRRLGYGQADLAQTTGLAFAVRSISAEYLLPARLDDELVVTCSIESLGRAQVGFGQRVLRGGDLLLEARVRVACFELARGKAAPMPRELHEKLKAFI
ncbi:MAG: tol-pal system-associated acyl-CoA thioesterase [Rhodocyclaceae bacterium]|jgi:acyl-CoA thioester hydrolase|nr:tol-pal system-associated acyl-CoA thioesterase [Rhodocyclaceae bacterium]